MTTASPAIMPMFSDHGEDDDFGEFEFAVSESSSISPNIPLNFAVSIQPHRSPVQGVGDDDDEWGCFVENPLRPAVYISPDQPAPPTTAPSYSSSSLSLFTFDQLAGLKAPPPDLTPVSPETWHAEDKKWPKPSGPLPLSLFGADDEEDAGEGWPSSFDPPLTATSIGFSGSSEVPASNGSAFPRIDDLRDQLAGLYGQQDSVLPAASANASGSGDNSQVYRENGPSFNFTDGNISREDDFDEGFWEFKDAFPATTGGDIVHTSVAVDNAQKLEDMQEAGQLPKVLRVDQQQEGTYASNNDCGNSFGNTYGFTPSFFPAFEHGSLESGLNPNIHSQDTSTSNSVLESTDLFAKTEIINGFPAVKSHVQNVNLEDLFDSAWKTEKVDNGTKGLKNDASIFNINDLMLSANDDPLNMSPAFSREIAGDENFSLSTVAHGALNNTYAKDIHSGGIEESVSNNTDTHVNSALEPLSLLDFYSRLKRMSCAMALHHIENIKLRRNDEGVTDEEPELMVLKDDIAAAFTKLGISDPNVERIDQSPQDELSVNKLLEFHNVSGLQAFDVEYLLSEKVSSVEKGLSPAMWLFEHSSSVLHILMQSSLEEQHCYISLWSKMASACELELKHGALILSQVVAANVRTELLQTYQGQRYLLALGEIYRVMELISAAVRLYKPWILINVAASGDILRTINNSTDIWRDSGLKQALESIASVSTQSKVVADKLIKSVNSISKLDGEALRRHVSSDGVQLCRLSLLPLDIFPDIMPVVWDGCQYLCKVANLWANRVSHESPRLTTADG